MKLIVGLGNPGAKYENTRHNIGFMLADALVGPAPWREKFKGLETRIQVAGSDVRLLKPMTFMNLSGDSVVAAAKFYKIEAKDILVIHDELDLAPGKIKAKHGGGHAGHNGLRSITNHMGAGFDRLRVGIGHPGHKDAVSSYVLHDFAKADQDWIDDISRALPKALPDWIEGGSQSFKMLWHGRALRARSRRFLKKTKRSQSNPQQSPEFRQRIRQHRPLISYGIIFVRTDGKLTKKLPSRPELNKNMRFPS